MGEEELARIVDRLAPSLREVDILAVIAAPGGRIVWANDAVAAGFGDLAGAYLTSIVALRLRIGFQAWLDEAFQSATAPDFDTVVVDRHGNQAAVSVALARLESGGALVGVLGLLRVPPTASRDGVELVRTQVLTLLGDA
jgi:hypothetical protein